MTRIIILAALLLPFSTLAAVSLKPINYRLFEKAVYQSSVKYTISGGSPVANQVFQVEIDGHKAGSFIAGQGFDVNDRNVCFVAWAAGNNQIDDIIPTIGFNQWEAESCNATKAVSVIENKDNVTKIAVIYEAASPNATAFESAIFNFNKQGVSLNQKATESVGSDGAKSIKELKILLNK